MAAPKKKKTAKKTSAQKKKKDLRNEIYGVILIGLGILLFLSLVIQAESAFKTYIADGFMRGAFGIGAYLIPLLLAFFGVQMIRVKRPEFHTGKLVMTLLMVLSGLGLVHMGFSWFENVGTAETAAGYGEALHQAYEAGKDHIGMGGFAGLYVYPLTRLVSNIGAIVVFFAVVIIALIVLFNLSLKDTGEKVSQKVRVSLDEAGQRFRRPRKKKNYDYDIGAEEKILADKESKEEEEKESEAAANIEVRDFTAPRRPVVIFPQEEEPTDTQEEELPPQEEDSPVAAEEEMAQPPAVHTAARAYQAPPFTLLNPPQATKKNVSTDHSQKIEMMESTLKSFGITAWVENITVGPAITRYELSIERGTRVSKILSLADDIALSMAAVGVRIEAPIPGKSAIGIEIPNESVSMVTLREVLESGKFGESASPVSVGLGKDITGTAIIADLSKMPHLLIAGQTGAGKSVCINSIITSILYKASPQEVRLILVDPKKVELNVYNGIPHLLTPVVTDPKKAAGALQFVVRKMEERYETFAKRKVKDIVRYNEVVTEAGEEPMPRIVVIVDELNDLMLVARGEVEDSVMRIAQLARAAGIYLILATQRPSVNVITGVIKANIPSRIAFAVASGFDSKTILDTGGAEKLVGKGDMLFHLNGEPKPVRVQGAFVGEQEVEKVVEFIKARNLQAEYIGEEQLVMRELKPTHGGSGENPNDEEDTSGDDELFPAAVEYAIECGSISISALQRRFKVGYSRAGRLIDSMELRSIIEPAQGSKARKVLVTREEFWAKYDERLD